MLWDPPQLESPPLSLRPTPISTPLQPKLKEVGISPWGGEWNTLDTVPGPPTLSEGAEAPALRNMHSSEQDRQETSGHGTRENKSIGNMGGLSSQAVREGFSEEGTFEGSRKEARWTSKGRCSRQRACKGGARRQPGASAAPDIGSPEEGKAQKNRILLKAT